MTQANSFRTKLLRSLNILAVAAAPQSAEKQPSSSFRGAPHAEESLFSCIFSKPKFLATLEMTAYGIFSAVCPAALCAAVALLMFAPPAPAQTRQREPNSEYASRRDRLRAQVDGPIVIFGYTGKESASEAYVFNQETNFYYLTGHNEEGAALLLIPDTAAAKGWSGPAKEIFYLPPHNAFFEQWNGPRIAPNDLGANEKTGFANIEVFENLTDDLHQLAKMYPTFYTLLPSGNTAGYPHLQNWQAWLTREVPGVKLAQIEAKIGALRQIKSPGEIALLTRAIELSIDAHLDAMRNMRPGLYEYQLAARMVAIHQNGGCETEAYSPIVGAGFNSTVLHYDKLGAVIQDGDIVVLDVGGQYSGYTADITRTLPANGKYTARQREIYEVVYGAQQAALAALKPGAQFGGPNGLQVIARDYMNAHGKDLHGAPLGKYFIHGLGHHLGLDVHDAGDAGRVFEPGMVITIEPGIYIPEEKIGVRIEDDVLITETGYKLLTARLPRSPDEIEKAMAEGKKQSAGAGMTPHETGGAAPIARPLSH
jgi:Xaa-Pro aminopeptidase